MATQEHLRTRILRRVRYPILALLFLGIAAAGIGAALMPKEKVRIFIENELSAALGTKTTIKTASVSFLPLGVALDEMKVGGKKSDPLYVRMPRLRLGLRWSELLRGRLVFSHVLLESPTLRVDLDRWSKGEGAGEAGDISLKIDHLGIDEADLALRTGGEEYAVEGLSYDARIALGSTYGVEGGLVWDALVLGGLRLEHRAGLEHSVEYDPEADSLEIARMRAEVDKAALSLEGKISNLSSEPSGTLGISMPSTDIRALKGLAGNALREVDLRGMVGLKGELILAKTFGYSLGIEWREGSASIGSGPALSKASAKLTLTPEKMALKEFAWSMGDKRSTVAGTVGLHRSDLPLALKASVNLPLALAGPMVEGSLEDLEGVLDGEYLIRGTVKAPELTGQGTLSRLAFDAKPLGYAPCKKGGARFKLTGDTIEVGEFFASCAGDELKGNAALDIRSLLAWSQGAKVGSVPFRVALQAANLDLDRLVLDDAGQAADAAEPDPQSLPMLLKGDIDVRAGRFHTDGLEAQDLELRGTLGRGEMTMDRFAIKAFEGQVSGRGQVAILKPSMDFHVRTSWDDFELAAVMAYASGLEKILRLRGFVEGRTSGSGTFKGRFDEEGSLQENVLTAVGEAAFRNLKVTKHPLQGAVAGFVGLDKEAKVLSIKSLSLPFDIKDGRVFVSGASMEAEDIDAVLTGWQALDGSVEGSVGLDLPKRVSDSLKKVMPAGLGPMQIEDKHRIRVPLKVSGSHSKPKVAVDADAVRRANKKSLSDAVSEASSGLQNEIKARGARGVLKDPPSKEEVAEKVKDTGKTIRREADKATKEVKEEGKKLLKGLGIGG